MPCLKDSPKDLILVAEMTRLAKWQRSMVRCWNAVPAWRLVLLPSLSLCFVEGGAIAGVGTVVGWWALVMDGAGCVMDGTIGAGEMT